MSDEPFTEKEEDFFEKLYYPSLAHMTEGQLCDGTLFHMSSCVCDMCEELRRRKYPRTPAPLKPKNEVSIPIPFEFFKKRTLAELLEIRDDFIVDNRMSTCTCDTCCISLMCALAYDFYNTDGDCLLEK